MALHPQGRNALLRLSLQPAQAANRTLTGHPAAHAAGEFVNDELLPPKTVYVITRPEKCWRIRELIFLAIYFVLEIADRAPGAMPYFLSRIPGFHGRWP